MMERAGLAPLSEEEFVADVIYATAEEFFSSLMDIAAPIQNLLATLTGDQKTRAKHGIIEAVNRYGHQGQIVLPIAVRMVAARKPVHS